MFSKNFYLLEGQDNVINSLSLINESDKPLQVKLVEAAITYIISDDRNYLLREENGSGTNKENQLDLSEKNKLKILNNLIRFILSLIDTKSNFLIKNISFLLNSLSKTDLILKVQSQTELIMFSIINIIIKHENYEIKKINFQTLCEITRDFEDIEGSVFVTHLEKLFEYVSKKLHKMIIYKGVLTKHEYLVMYFLRLISNCALAKTNETISELNI